MPTPTYTPLANITLGSSAASVTFSSITAGFRDYVIIATGTVTSETGGPQLRLNSDTGTNYPHVYMLGDGANTYSGTSTTRTYATIVNQSYWRTSTPNTVRISIMDASATDKHKTILTRSDMGGTDGGTEAFATRWASTSAVTSIQILNAGAASFAAGSSFALYGVAA